MDSDLLPPVFGAQRADKVHNVPYLVWLHGIVEVGHRSPAQAGNQVTVHLPVRISTLKLSSARKVERHDGIALAVGEGGGRRTIAPSILAMTGPTIHTLEKFCAPLYALG